MRPSQPKTSKSKSSLARKNYNAKRGKMMRNRRNSSYYIEIFTFTIASGNSANVTVGTLGNRPPRSNFRIGHASVQFTCLTAPTHPPALQLLLYGPSGEYVASNHVKLSSHTRATSVIRYPSSADWFPYNNANSDNVMTIDCVCTGPDATSVETVTGIVTIKIFLQQEVVVSTCPTLTDIIPTSDRIRLYEEKIRRKNQLISILNGSTDLQTFILNILRLSSSFEVVPMND